MGNTGSLTFDALKFPIAAGKVPVSVDLSLSSLLPSALTTTKTVAKAIAKNGDVLFCMEIDSAAAMEVHPASGVQNQAVVSAPEAKRNEVAVAARQLALTWKDC